MARMDLGTDSTYFPISQAQLTADFGGDIQTVTLNDANDRRVILLVDTSTWYQYLNDGTSATVWWPIS